MNQFDNNPLFIAYAYNGGGGYTRSQLKKGLFKRKIKIWAILVWKWFLIQKQENMGKSIS